MVTNRDRKSLDKGIQHDLNEAQQCKCENRGIDCFKLQSELTEVRMEFKSVKEIVNILDKDLTSIDVRIHNLHEEESFHIATQPFENWPSRHSTKKSYSEVTAYKPCTVTINRFQLLENLKENGPPVDVPREFSQPGKDYQCCQSQKCPCER